MDMKKKLLLSMILLALCAFVSASLYDYDKVDSVENIADEDDDDPISGDDGIIWND